ncbi:(2Fe-2S) ferredoxin domain-containing protein [Oceanotoga sp. DSM 15011]|jgi:NADP-reducing hydrogenase subunit HndB|uniref:NAD(P)-dependent iron-only hydrogenase iron-sulfur protein n=1 Tax=Oceanotoga teriensis TaxID=515440 RepID=A0AA45HHH5_9BACT|nr:MULTISPECIES: (2Fe-2S) ferredoxin domain-containing protein [Oceanotoga]MDN5341860.1 NADP-reducing hydrogenase subunit HndB [Oceanotoga sp.]MDO7976659.1 (2Fe-2S) ferredoxin domain-containing protein [Oceanotoga teriensis]PWJ87011.1 NAD(P)-dependent iron-only hydrogenase iron-sulfur protein [Oceanotoga teriensis]UYP00694.1 (2Fe-2S) ferredoxin domain-containing protein [Oceanotoga sp. DSM 15011]
MSKIKSLQDLMNLKETATKNMKIRNAADEKEKIILKVAMGTCGISAGAKETFNALVEAIDKKNLEHVVVVQTGCMGYCHAEPTVEVVEPNKESILYGHIDAEKAETLIEKHIINGELLQDSIIGETHQSAE